MIVKGTVLMGWLAGQKASHVLEAREARLLPLGQPSLFFKPGSTVPLFVLITHTSELRGSPPRLHEAMPSQRQIVRCLENAVTEGRQVIAPVQHDATTAWRQVIRKLID